MRKPGFFTLLLLLAVMVLSILLMLNKAPKNRTAQYDSTIIVEKIVNIQELATIKSNFTGVISYKDAIKLFKFNVPLTGKFFLLKYNGYMKAGVDFSRVHVEVEEKKVTVSIPRAQILDIVIDENSIAVFSESDNMFNPIKIGDVTEALSTEKQNLRREAVKGGLLDEAYRQAELTLRTFLTEMGFEEVVISQQLSLPEMR